MGNDTLTLIISVVLALNVCVTAFLSVRILLSKYRLPGKTVHYTLYIGLNDKATYTQLISTEEAKQTVDTICMKYVNRFTVHDALGKWNDEKDVITHEHTIVCDLDDLDEITLHRICDEIRDALNQNTVLIRKEYSKLHFYAGEER